ncbi:MAG: hypothetical protein AAB947_01355 [Patescibacteria group bacterium]
MPNTATQPSFIPRETPRSSVAPQRQKGLADLLALISIVLLVASIALAVGVFLYKGYLDSSVASKIKQLESAKKAFEPSLIHELTRLDDRMRSASTVLGGHLAPTAFLRMLERVTVVSIAYTSLNFEAVDMQNMSIKMNGVAGSVNAIALQADLFAKGSMVTSPIFSNINREADGIRFDLSALINPIAINYAQIISGATTKDASLPELDIPVLSAPATSDTEQNSDLQ